MSEMTDDLTRAVNMTRSWLRQHGYSEKEVNLACLVFGQLMNATRVTAKLNEVDLGHLIACVFAIVKAVDASADQATAKKLGHLFPQGKN